MQQGRSARAARPNLPPGVEAIRISSNENPLGPGKAAIDAILGKFPEANRYPFNSTPLDADLEILIAKLNSAKRENVVLGVGSQELLKNAARVFLSPTKHLVIPSPTYGDPAGFAQNVLKVTVKTAPVDRQDAEDRSERAAAARQGRRPRLHLQPEQPDGDDQQRARRSSDFIAEVKKTSPTTAILIDEAYCDYVTDPAFQTAIPIALATPSVVVARTFSKAYGMAGVRIGYAIGDAATIKKMSRLADAVQREHVRRRGRGRVAQGSAAHQGRERAQQGGARLHGQGAGGPGLHRRPTRRPTSSSPTSARR